MQGLYIPVCNKNKGLVSWFLKTM